jgi:L-alanine-DL-glutamate epimerase-like enolase superfamily enzyme
MHLTVRTERLRLAETLATANWAADSEDVAVVSIEHQGITAYGEGVPADFLGESIDAVVAALSADGRKLLGDDPLALEAASRRLVDWDGPQGAKMALDGALHDWFGKHLGQPVWRLLGLGRVTPPTSFTIGLASVDDTVARLRRAPGFEVYKIKVGGPADLERLEAIRAVSDARLRIDGNQGWTLETARELTPRLLDLGVEFVEQPFPVDDRDSFLGYRALPRRLPVLIDEGCTTLASVAPIAGYADGIVVKAAKSGGIREALRMIHAARALGLRVMLGCMVESQLGIGQAAQLGQLADHVDLDGHLLLREQPFSGLGLRDGRLVLADAPGLGVEPVATATKGRTAG